MLASWRRADRPNAELLTQPVRLDFYRALTDDRAGHGREWVQRRLHQTTSQVGGGRSGGTWPTTACGCRWQSASRRQRWRGASTTRGPTASGATRFASECTGGRTGCGCRRRLRASAWRLGLGGVERVRWWGRGPGESYRDKKLSQQFGNWQAGVDELWVDYEFPQDGGNRTDVRWVEFASAGAAGELQGP